MAYSRSPSENFIKYLISQRKFDTNTILRMMEEYGMEGISSRYIEQLENEMGERPDPWDDTDAECKEYLRQNKIADLWFPNGAVKEAYEIIAVPQLRADVEQLLLSPLRLEEVVSRLNSHHGITLTPDGVRAFGHYFWNKSLLSMHEWAEFLDDRPGAFDRITILKAAPDMAGKLVPWVAGMSGPPTGLNTGTVARRMRDIAFMKVLETERQPASLAHSKMMKNYMDVIRAAESEMRQSDVALKDVLAAFEKFRLRKDKEAVPAIEEVAGPNFSQSGEGTDGVVTMADRMMEDDHG
jgi:hypothetical protein